MWALIKIGLGFLPTILGWFGIGQSKDERDKEREAGEKLGRAESNAAVNQTEINDAQKSVDAGRAAGAADDDGGVRNPHAGDRPWNPDGVG